MFLSRTTARRRAYTTTVAISTLALAIAACSQGEPGGGSVSYEEPQYESAATVDAAPASSSEDGRGPGIDVTAAPGVAFNYRYAFRVPSERIKTVQEAHATACEKLGIEKCRIIGMRYQLRGEDEISAQLALRLDPALARDFGKTATDEVVNAEGMLVDQLITGTEVGSQIDQATRDKGRIEADIARLEQELRAMSATNSARGELVARIDDLKRQVRSLESSRDANREALAGTPMVFNYGSGRAIPGFDRRSPLSDAFAQSWYGFQQVLAFLIIILGFIIPIGAALWGAHRLNKQFGWLGNGGGYGPKKPEAAGEQ